MRRNLNRNLERRLEHLEASIHDGMVRLVLDDGEPAAISHRELFRILWLHITVNASRYAEEEGEEPGAELPEIDPTALRLLLRSQPRPNEGWLIGIVRQGAQELFGTVPS